MLQQQQQFLPALCERLVCPVQSATMSHCLCFALRLLLLPSLELLLLLACLALLLSPLLLLL